jgi:hypothetical protein
MKKVLLQCLFLFLFGTVFGQVTHPDNENFVIGLPKISAVQLDLIKTDLALVNQVVTSEFVFKEKLLIIETSKTLTPVLTYPEIQAILTKYFNTNDIYLKDASQFDQLKAEFIKYDKYTIK